jgi:hypothetical protein
MKRSANASNECDEHLVLASTNSPFTSMLIPTGCFAGRAERVARPGNIGNRLRNCWPAVWVYTNRMIDVVHTVETREVTHANSSMGVR